MSLSPYFQKKQPEEVQPTIVETPSAPAEPMMTRSQHWDTINAERKAKKAAGKPQTAVVPPKPKTKTGAFGTSRLKR